MKSLAYIFHRVLTDYLSLLSKFCGPAGDDDWDVATTTVIHIAQQDELAPTIQWGHFLQGAALEHTITERAYSFHLESSHRLVCRDDPTRTDVHTS